MESCVGVSVRRITRDVPTRGLRTLARPGNAARSWRGETRGVCEGWRGQRSPRMDGGTSGVRGWMAGEQHRDMGGRPRERDIKWTRGRQKRRHYLLRPEVPSREGVPKAEACPGGSVPRLVS